LIYLKPFRVLRVSGARLRSLVCSCGLVVGVKGATRGAKEAEAPPPFSQVKVEIKDKKLQFLANFVHATRSKCYCNTTIPSQLSNFVAF